MAEALDLRLEQRLPGANHYPMLFGEPRGGSLTVSGPSSGRQGNRPPHPLLCGLLRFVARSATVPAVGTGAPPTPLAYPEGKWARHRRARESGDRFCASLFGYTKKVKKVISVKTLKGEKRTWTLVR